MKQIFSIWVFLLMLGVAAAQMPVNPSVTNKPVTTKWQVPAGDIRAFFEETKSKAEQGDADAQYWLAWAYENGNGVETNSAEALKWYRMAAERGNAVAQYVLGKRDLDAIMKAEVHKTPETNATVIINDAIGWFRKAAKRDNIPAQKQLAEIFKDGGYFFFFKRLASVETNLVEAAQWYLLAAKQGDAEAQNSIGLMYEKGEGVYQDYVEAVKWYRSAANQGDCRGQTSLGFMYWLGKGVPQDFVQAYKWFNIASATSPGFLGLNSLIAKDAADDRDKIASEMTPQQIAEGQRLSAAFVPKKEEKSNLPSFVGKQAKMQIVATGTGFFITDDGCLISNYHVVKDAAKVRIVTSVGTVDAKVVQVDSANDLALLKAAGKFTPLPIAASRTVKLGATVATVGFPDTGLQGFSPKLAKGEIGSLAGIQDDPRYFQISVPVQPGNSGGALVDARGNVVGIVSAKLSAKAALDATGQLPENVNYAVKSSLLLSFLESVPDVSAKLKDPNTKDEAFEDVVKSAQDAAVLVLVY